MKKRLAILAATTAAALGGLGVVSAPAFAVHSASCGWPTNYGQFYSSSYNEYPQYTGHVWINGHNYRAFSDYSYWWWQGGAYLHQSVVYCG